MTRPRTTAITRRRTLSLLFAAALIGSACGGSDDTSGASDGPGATASGDQSIADQADAAEDALERAGNGAGSGQVVIDGATYAFDAEICFFSDDDLTVQGVATGPDGEQAWVEIDRTYDTRDELLEFFDEAFVDTLTGGKDFAENVSVRVDVGRTELYASAPDDKPEWRAETDLGIDYGLTWTMDGGRISGSGSIGDDHEIGAAFNELVPMTFEGGCG